MQYEEGAVELSKYRLETAEKHISYGRTLL